jgi:plasmid stabilization system protein ParE
VTETGIGPRAAEAEEEEEDSWDEIRYAFAVRKARNPRLGRRDGGVPSLARASRFGTADDAERTITVPDRFSVPYAR